MRLTRIEVQKKHKQRYSLYVDEVFWLGVSEGTLLHFQLQKGQELTVDQQEAIEAYERIEALYLLAIRYLSRSLRSRQEVYHYMQQQALKGQEWQQPNEREDFLLALEPALAQVIERLEQEGYLNDTLYGRSLVLTEARVGRKGPRLIEAKLKEKGLSPHEISDVMEAYDSDLLEENLTTLIQKFYQRQRQVPAKRLRSKLQVYLYGKGYSQDMVEPYVQMSQPEPDVEYEGQLLDRAAQKALRSLSRRYEGRDLRYKLQEHLARKGFDYEAIRDWICQHSDQVEAD